MFDPEIEDRVVLLADPIVRGFWEHLQHDPPTKGQRSLFVHTWLSDNGEGPSPAQGAPWLGIKRTYMSHRPNLRRVYATIRDATPYGAALGQLGFAPAGQVEMGHTYYLAVNDMGPDSVNGWLAPIIATELGINEEQVLDPDARELVLGRRRVPLTRLEFAVMRYLGERSNMIETVSEVAYRFPHLGGGTARDAGVGSSTSTGCARGDRDGCDIPQHSSSG